VSTPPARETADVRALRDLVVALLGTVTVAARRSSRARVVALGLIASLALGGHLAASRVGGDHEPDLAAPRDRADAVHDEDGPAGGGPLAASLTATGDGGSSATGAEAGGGPEANAPAAAPPFPTAGPPGDDGRRATAPGEAATSTTAPAGSTTTPPPTAPPDGSVTTTAPPGAGSDGDSPGLVGGLLDLLGLSG
jgi:hypothetical protein